MKNFVIRLVKNNPLLYRGAKKVYRTVHPAKPTLYKNNDYHIVYELQDPEEIKDIIGHYNSFRRENMRLIVIVSGNQLALHALIRTYPGVIFLSRDYYLKYNKKPGLENMILTDYRKPVSDVMEIL